MARRRNASLAHVWQFRVKPTFRGQARSAPDRRKNQHLWGKLIELLPQLQPCTFQGVGVVGPVAPARGNRLDDGTGKGSLPQVLEDLYVFIILDAITNSFESNARSWLG